MLAQLSAPDHVVLWSSPGSGKSTLLGQWVEHAGEAHAVTLLDAGSGGIATALEDAAADAVLVIDNAELADDHDRAALADALDRPPGPRLVVAGRHDPLRVSPARWLTSRELRSGDLAFTPDEIVAVVAARGGEISAETAGVLAERTAGWATGIALAAHVLAASDDVEAAALGFRADHRAIGDYLVGEVLGSLTEDERHVLLSCAIVRVLPPDLARALSAREDAPARLDSLSRRNLLVERSRDGDFTMHPVMGAYLAAEARDRGMLRPSHRAAAAWCAERGDAAAALRHAVASEEPAVVEGVLRDHGIALALSGSSDWDAALELAAGTEGSAAGLLRWLREAPHLTPAGRAGAVEWDDDSRRLKAVLDALVDETASWPALDGAPQTVLALEAFARARRDALRAVDEQASLSAVDALRGVAAGAALAGWQWLRACAVESIVTLSMGTWHWHVAEAELRTHATADLPEHVLASAAGTQLVLMDAALAYIRCEPLAAALARSARGADARANPSTALRIRMFAALDAIGVHPSQEDADRIDGLLAAAPLHDPVLLSLVLVPWLSSAAAHDNRPILDHIVWSSGRTFGERSVEHALARFTAAPERSAATALRAVLDARPRTWDPLTTTHARLRLAVHASAHGATARALSDLGEAVMGAHHLRAARPFLLFGADGLALLRTHADRLGPWSEAAHELARAASSALREERPLETTTLTPRERALLDELPVHQTVAEIARRQQVSPNTIKSQLKSVYRKLGVDNRADAVEEGRRVGLLGGTTRAG